MGYIEGGLGKNGQGIVVSIYPKMHTTRTGLGYDDATSSFVDTRKVFILVGGV